MRVTLVSRKFADLENLETEKWYGTKYGRVCTLEKACSFFVRNRMPLRIFVMMNIVLYFILVSYLRYGTKYLKEAISQKNLDDWSNAGTNEKFAMPGRNDFIPTNFDILCEKTEGKRDESLRTTGRK